MDLSSSSCGAFIYDALEATVDPNRRDAVYRVAILLDWYPNTMVCGMYRVWYCVHGDECYCVVDGLVYWSIDLAFDAFLDNG